MKFLFMCLFLGLLSSAYAEDFKNDEAIKADIQKDLNSLSHMHFKAILCPIEDDSGGTEGGGIPIPQLPWKFGGGHHHGKKCDGASEYGKFKIHVKGFFFLRFKYKLKITIDGNAIAAHIHCKVDGEDGPIAASLNIEGGGQISTPDNGNGCGYESFEDLYMAMKKGETYVVVHSEEKPDGHLKGDLKPKH